MGWLFTAGSTRRDLIGERTRAWTTEGAEGMTITSLPRPLLPGRGVLGRFVGRLGTHFHQG